MDAIYNYFRSDATHDHGDNEMNEIDNYEEFDVAVGKESEKIGNASTVEESETYDEADDFDDDSETIMFNNDLSENLSETEEDDDQEETYGNNIDEKPLVAIARPFPLLCDSRIKGLDIVPPDDGYLPRGYIQQEYKQGMKLYEKPGMIVDNKKPWILRLQWQVRGTTATVMTGTWDVTIRLQRMCGRKRIFNVVGQSDDEWFDVTRESVEHLKVEVHDYDEAIEVPAGLVPDGYYKLNAFVDLRLPDGKEAPVCGVGVSQVVRFVGG